MSIFDKISQQIPSVLNEIKAEAQELNQVIPELREHLLNEGQIVTFAHKPEPYDGSMVAVDGAKVNAPLAGADLLLAAATSGDGLLTQRAYPEGEERPEEVWVKGTAHKSNNDDIASDVMAALELRVLRKTKADVRIIDGTYLGNVSNILFPLSDKVDTDRIDTLFKAVHEDEDNVLRDALQEILYPPRDNSGNIVSLPKNDTAKVFSKEFLKDHPRLLAIMPDRIIATKLLHPGEMLVPRVIYSNPALINNLQKLDARKYTGEFKELYLDLIKDKVGLLRRLDNQETEEGILHASYFKPHVALKESKAMKIEFPFYYQNSKMGISSLIEFAQDKISTIDSDIIDGMILEPWCQHAADLAAKEISSGTEVVKDAIVSTSTDPYEMVGFMRGYRT